MPKNAKRRARMAASEKAELEAFRAAAASAQPVMQMDRNTFTSHTGDLRRCDWHCRQCDFYNFGHNISCRRCGAARQSGLNMPGVYRGRAIAYNPSQPAIKSFTSPPAPPSFRVKPPAGYPGILPVGPHNSTAGQRIGTRQNGGGSVQTNVVGLRQPTNTYHCTVPAANAQSWADKVRGDPTVRVGATENSADGPQDGRHRVTGEAPVSSSAHQDSRNLDQVAREGDEDFSDGESQDDELNEEPTSWSLQKKMRSLEFARRRRERKLQKQQQEVEEQALYVEEQRRRLSSLQFAVDETKEDIRSIDEQSASLSKLLSEIKAAQASAHEVNDSRDTYDQ